MSRNSTFMDREFGHPDFDPYNQGVFEKDLVFVAMSFHEDLREVYAGNQG